MHCFHAERKSPQISAKLAQKNADSARIFPGSPKEFGGSPQRVQASLGGDPGQAGGDPGTARGSLRLVGLQALMDLAPQSASSLWIVSPRGKGTLHAKDISFIPLL